MNSLRGEARTGHGLGFEGFPVGAWGCALYDIRYHFQTRRSRGWS